MLFSDLPQRISDAMKTAVTTPEFQSALHDPANAAFAKQLAASQASGGSGAAGGVLQDSSFLSNLDPALAKPFLVGFSQSMDLVFLLGSMVMVLGFLVMLMLPQVELRKTAAGAMPPAE